MDDGLLVLPLGRQRPGLLLQIGQFGFELLQALATGLVFLLGQRRAFDLILQNLAIQPIQLGRLRIEFHLQPRGRLVHQIHRLVGQEPVADVAVRQGRSGHQRAILNAHAMVGFVALLEAAQNRDGVLHRRFRHLHRLETPLQCRIFFDVLAVLVQRGGTDAAQFTASQLWLEHIGRIGSALRSTGPHDGVQLIDEEDDPTLSRRNLLEEGLETVLELAAIFRASDHRADIERNDPTVLERLGHIAIDDSLGQALDDGRLAHPGFTNEHRVVLRAPRQHLHDTPDLVIPADHRVDLTLAGQSRQVLAVLLQGLKFFLRIRIGHTLIAPHRAQRLEHRIALETQPIGDATKTVAALLQQPQEEVFCGNILILERLGLG